MMGALEGYSGTVITGGQSIINLWFTYDGEEIVEKKWRRICQFDESFGRSISHGRPESYRQSDNKKNLAST